MAKRKTAGADTSNPPFIGASWPALDSGIRKVAALIANPRNARTHPPAQIAAYARSVREFGITRPVLVDEHDMILAGHGLVLACAVDRNEAGEPIEKIEEVPVAVARGWSEEKKAAYLEADNRIWELGGWNETLRAENLEMLREADFDLNVIGWDAPALTDFFASEREPAERQTIEVDAAAKQKLKQAWSAVVRQWAEIVRSYEQRGYISTTFTRQTMVVWFLRALYYGHDIPRSAMLAYVPERLFTSGDKGSFVEMLDLLANHENIIDKMEIFSQGGPRLDRIVACTIPLHGLRQPGDFPALLARRLIAEFCPAGGAVLDPCHGWGGRMLGFLLSDAASYCGFDVSPHASRGVRLLFDDLKGYCATPKSADLQQQPFERSKLRAAGFDFAMTSPPYYNTEKYAGDEQSWRTYKTLDEWAEKFFLVMMQKVSDALKPGATFCLQIGSQTYDLRGLAERFADRAGFVVSEIRTTEMINNLMGTDPGDGEIVVVLKKKPRA